MTTKIAVGDARQMLRLIRNESINSCVTSPPYWMLRDYHAGPTEIGREPTFQGYIDHLLQVIDEVHRVLLPHGTFWLNLGDTYITQAGTELPHKSLCLMPYRVAIAMEDRGWIVRNVVIWHKPDGMPESVQDRFTVDYEPVFFCAKNPNYYFKQQLRPYADKTLARHKVDPTCPTQAPAEPIERLAKNLIVPGRTTHGMHVARANGNDQDVFNPAGANMRCVWRISTAGYRGAHFAVFPERLVEICIEAGCPPGGTVLDPFLGSGTVAVVAERLGRTCYGIELNPEFAKQARERILAEHSTRKSERHACGQA
jgi:site-specific DNA-methyltransferase (adenine-specific)